MSGHNLHGPGHHHGGHESGFESQAMAESLELEGEVLLGLTANAIAIVADLCERAELRVDRVVDLGCGPGVGTCALAERFAQATVVAADGSAAMLDRATASAARSGLGDRVVAIRAEVPAGLAALGRADLVWASMLLHHVGDQAGALGHMRSLLEPEGVLALIEGTGLGGATPSTDPAKMLEEAGFEVALDQVVTTELDPLSDDSVRRFAERHLRGMPKVFESFADPVDLSALGALIGDPSCTGALAREGTRLRVERRLCVAGRRAEDLDLGGIVG